MNHCTNCIHGTWAEIVGNQLKLKCDWAQHNVYLIQEERRALLLSFSTIWLLSRSYSNNKQKNNVSFVFTLNSSGETRTGSLTKVTNHPERKKTQNISRKT